MKLIASLPTKVTDSEGKLLVPEWKRVTAAWEEMKRVLNSKPDGSGITIELQTNGVDNTLQSLLNLIAGSNVTLTPDGSGGVTISAASGSTIALKTNGVLNALQTVLNLIAGSHITLTPDGAGGTTFDVAWPAIPTVPASFTAALHKVLKSYDATTGLFSDVQLDYSDLTGTPSIPVPAYSRGFDLKNLTVGTDVVPHIRAGKAGTLSLVTGVLRKVITSDLVFQIVLDGAVTCTLTIPQTTAINSIVSSTTFISSVVNADSIYQGNITASDGSSDLNGIAVVQMFWI